MLFELTPPSLAVLPLHGTVDALVYIGDPGTTPLPPPRPGTFASVMEIGDPGTTQGPPPRPGT
jgi:hypothetical protein